MKCVAIMVLVFSMAAVSYAEPPESRTVWAYEGGWFQHVEGQKWEELNFKILVFGVNKGEPVPFQEVSRTEEEIVIRDPKRGMLMQLTATRSSWKRDNEESWHPFIAGRWRNKDD